MVPAEWSLSEVWPQLHNAHFFPSCKIIPRVSFSEQLKKYDVLTMDKETQLLILGRSAECLSSLFPLWASPQFFFL